MRTAREAKTYYTLTEAASAIGVSYITLRNMIARREIEVVYSGAKKQRARYITIEAINNLLKKLTRNMAASSIILAPRPIILAPRRTNADKREALEKAWENRHAIWPREDGADPSAEILADACGVSRRTVVRFLIENRTQLSYSVFGKDGKTQTRHKKPKAEAASNEK